MMVGTAMPIVDSTPIGSANRFIRNQKKGRKKYIQSFVAPSANVLIVDDLLATGGTACAACKLIHQAKANIVGTAFWIELNGLGGREKLEQQEGCEVLSMLKY